MFCKVPYEYIEILRQLNANITNQIHSSHINILNHSNIKGFDGFIAETSLEKMMIYTADCLPVIGIGKHNDFVIHAGWQGLHKGILNNLTEQLKNTGKYDIYIGPHISKAHFQVKNDFIKQWANVSQFDNYYSHGRFDLAGYAVSQLNPIANDIVISDCCTYENKHMASFRRDKNKKYTNLIIHNLTH